MENDLRPADGDTAHGNYWAACFSSHGGSARLRCFAGEGFKVTARSTAEQRRQNKLSRLIALYKIEELHQEKTN